MAVPVPVFVEQEIDWGLSYAKLALVAQGLIAKKHARCTVLSPLDLVNAAFARYLSAPDQLGYQPCRGPLPPFLAGVMAKILLEHIHNCRAMESVDDEGFSQTPQTDPRQAYYDRISCEEVRRAVADDKELSDLVAAMSRDSGKGRWNQRVAQELGISSSEVRARLKRIRRRLQKGGICSDPRNQA